MKKTALGRLLDRSLGKKTPDECLAKAKEREAKFSAKFDDNEDAPIAGADHIKARLACIAEQKKLRALIDAGDGVAALAACPDAERAVGQFARAAAPSKKDKAKTVKAALKTMSALGDDQLKSKSTTELAELAFDLCAEGQPDSGEALTQLCRVYRNSEQDKEFIKQRKEQRKKIVANVAQMDEVANLFDDKGRVDKKAWRAIARDEDKVQELLKKVSDSQAAELGLPPIDVTTYSEPADADGSTDMGGCVWHSDGPATISLNAHKDAVSDPKQALITIIHETYHAQQDMLVKKLMAGDLPPTDPIYPQVLMYAANKPGNGYLPPSVSQPEYEAQPVEVDAELQGDATATAIFLAIKKTKRAAAKKAAADKAAADKAAAEQAAAATAATGPAATGPAATGPAATGPAATATVATGPAAAVTAAKPEDAK